MFAIWALTERTPWLIGDFVWTAMDYLGEAGIGGSSLVSAKSRPGVLEAVAWRGARVVARRRLETVGAPAGVRLRAEKPGGAGRGDVSFVMIDVVDAQGRRVPDAAIALSAEVKGAGELVGFGSANPTAAGGYQSGQASSWQGRALAVVRGKGAAGRAGLSVSGTGLAPAMATIKLG